MDREIERKFFFDGSVWKGLPQKSTTLEQGYLPDTGAWEVRLRRAGNEFRYTMKTGAGLDRGEWEIKLAPSDFDTLWPRTEGQRVVKVREKYSWKGRTVEVDRYGGALDGLVVAEVEFTDLEKARAFVLPAGFGPELTYDPRFKNRALAMGATVPRQAPGRVTDPWSYGCLPYRRGSRGVELVVISTRRRDRWIFPKGQPEPGMTPAQVALTEAREEAGISGRVTGNPIVLPYVRETGTTNLLLFPVLVTRLTDRWLESGERDRQIVPIAESPHFGDLVRLGAQALGDFLSP